MTTSETVTNAAGEASFRIQAGEGGEDILTQVSSGGDIVTFLTVLGFNSPASIAVEADGQIVIADHDLDAVMRVNPITGSLSLISGESRGSGPPILFPGSIAVEADGRLIVSGFDLLRIDPDTGDRTMISDQVGGALAVEANGDLVVAIDDAILRVNPTTGDWRIVSGCTDVQDFECIREVGSGPPLGFLTDIDVEHDGHLIVANDVHVIRVDPVTGDRSYVSGCTETAPPSVDCVGETIGNGPLLNIIEGIAVEPDGFLVVESVFPTRAVIRIDPSTGDRETVSGNGRGEGPSFFRLKGGIAVAPDGSIVVVERERRTVIRVDSTTGDRQILVQPQRIGSGPLFRLPQKMAVQSNGNIVVTEWLEGIIQVDPVTGDRELISGHKREGPHIDFESIAVEADDQLIVAGGTGHTPLLRVNPITGDQSIVAGCNELDEFRNCIVEENSSPPLAPVDIAVEPDGHIAVVNLLAWSTSLSTRYSRFGNVARVEPITGEQRIVSGCPAVNQDLSCVGEVVGRGRIFRLGEIAVGADGHLIIGAFDPAGILRVEPGTGDRIVVSGCSEQLDEVCTGEIVGQGPSLRSLLDIAVEANGHIVVLGAAPWAITRVDPVTGNRSIVSGCTEGGLFSCTGDIVGRGPLFSGLPRAIAVEADGNLIVLDDSLKAIIRVNPVTGDRTFISRW